MRIVEAAWLAQPHPDLADAYAHVKLGDSARQRLVRVETLAAKAPGHIEGALAIARAAIDASEFARAREALAPFIAAPTQRVAMLMAEIERTEHGDSGRARAWTLRAVRALHDPVWTADGYVSDRWRPVSPVSGRLDAFQWQTPVAALPSDKGAAIEPSPFEEAMLAPPRRAASSRRARLARAAERSAAEPTPVRGAGQFSGPAVIAAVEPPPAEPPRAVTAAAVRRIRRGRRAALFRARQDIPKSRPGQHSGRDSDRPGARRSRDRRRGRPATNSPNKSARRRRQAGGWRGFLSRWGERERSAAGTLGASVFLAKSRRCPISGAGVFRPLPNAPLGSPQ